MADRLFALSATINDGVKRLTDLLEKNNVEAPTFDVGGALSDSSLSPELQGLRYTLMDAALEL